MSENRTESTKLQIKCPACQQVFSAKLPELEISNALYCSIVTGSHDKLVRCICGQHFVLMIYGAQAVWNCQPVGEDVVEKVSGSKIIKPNLVLAH